MPPPVSVLTFVPLALGNNDWSDFAVTSDLRFAYCFVPGFQNSHFVPSVFAWAAVRPKREVRPEELPWMYAPVWVARTSSTSAPSVSVSVPPFVLTSATIFSRNDDEWETAAKTTCALDWAATADPAVFSTEPAVLSTVPDMRTEPAVSAPERDGAPRSIDATRAVSPSMGTREVRRDLQMGKGI